MAQHIENSQTIWDCRWSYLGYRASRISNDQAVEVEPVWLCIRRGNTPRAVTEEGCATCRFWEAVPKV